MRVGIFARTFAPGALEAVLDRVVEAGVGAIQFNLALCDGSSLPERVDVEAIVAARAAVAARGLEMVALSGTYNMAHPDAAVRSRGAAALAEVIVAAPVLGTRVVTLCTGSRDADDMWRAHPANAGESAWSDMVHSVSVALEVAAREDVVLGIEPEPGNVVADAVAARRLLDMMGSPHLKIVMDGANLVAGSALDHQAATLEQAFDLLGDDLVLAHAKDLEGAAVVAAGRGGLDYSHYVELLRRGGYDGAVVLHGLAPQEVAASVAFLEEHLGGRLAELT